MSIKAKTLCCLLISLAVSLAQMSAQTAVNPQVVLQIPPGLSTVANPSIHETAADDRVSLLFPQMPVGTTLYKFNSKTQRFSANRFGKHGWEYPSEALRYGEGAFIFNPSKRQITVSFSIYIISATLDLPAGLSFVGNYGVGFYFEPAIPESLPMWPGTFTIGNYFNPQDGDVVYTFNHGRNRFDVHHFVAGRGWDSVPVVEIGESVFIFVKQPRTIQTTLLLVPDAQGGDPIFGVQPLL